MRGRKSIIYFAEARELPDSITPVYETTMGEANRANVTVHTVDARGLSSTRVGGRSSFDEVLGSLSASGQTGGGRGAIGNTSQTVPTEGGDPGGGALGDSNSFQLGPLSGSILERIAGDTGGLAIADTNDLGLGLGRVVEELGQYYEVVYVPARAELDGRFRKIGVKTSRPGVSLRTRSGYFATSGSAPVLLAYEMPLLAALGAKTVSPDFPHKAGLLSFGAKGSERQVLLMAQVPLAGVRVDADEARGVYQAHLSLLALVKDSVSRTVARVSHDWPIEGPLAERESVRRSSTVFRSAMTLPPGRYTLETAVQDRATGALSVERSSFVVAAATPGGLALGSLAVVRTAQPAQTTAGDWLGAGGVSILPELGTPVLPHSTAEVPLFLPIYSPGAAVEARLELRRDGRALGRSRVPLPPARAGRPHRLGLRLARDSAGPGASTRSRRASARAPRRPRPWRRSRSLRPGTRPRPRAPLRCPKTSLRCSSAPPPTCSSTSARSTTSSPRSPTRSGRRLSPPSSGRDPH